jgi:hypothetical protein
MMYSNFLQTKYDFRTQNAGASTGGIILFAMVFSPLFGKVLDVMGKRPVAGMYYCYISYLR